MLLGAGHVDTPCLAGTTVPDSQKESGRRRKAHFAAQAQGATLTSSGNAGKPPEGQGPRLQPGPALQAGRPEDSSLRPAGVTVLCPHTLGWKCSVPS